MFYLAIVLFIIGIMVMFLGWRWKTPSKDEEITTLKEQVYLKREILNMQNQMHLLQKIINTTRENESRREEKYTASTKEVILTKEVVSSMDNDYVLNGEESITSEGEVEISDSVKSVEQNPNPPQSHSNILSNYSTVLELSGQGYSIPEIARHLSLSQDGVVKVLRIYNKENNTIPSETVLELAGQGYSIPEIAHRLSLSQDGVAMVIKHQKGEILWL